MAAATPTEWGCDVDGVRVRCLRAGEGDGPPVVLLHGGGVDSATLSWRDAFPALADRHDVVAFDWPGYGDSDDLPASVDDPLAYYRRVLTAVVDDVGAERVTLVGVSMGGGVALGWTLAAPARVDRLVVIDSYGLGSTVPGGRLGSLSVRLPGLSRLSWALLRRSRLARTLTLRGIVGDPAAVTDDLVDDQTAAVRRPGAGRAFAAFQRAEVGPRGLRTTYLDRLPDLSTPTLVIHGEVDPVVPASWAVRAGTLCPDAEVRILPGVGHWPPRESPRRTVELIASFLDRP